MIEKKEQIQFLMDYYTLLKKRDEKNAANNFVKKIDLMNSVGEIGADTASFVKETISLVRAYGEEDFMRHIGQLVEIANAVTPKVKVRHID